jgi:hypothetical protein
MDEKYKQRFCILSDRPRGICDGLAVEIEDCKDRDLRLLHLDDLRKLKSSTKR